MTSFFLIRHGAHAVLDKVLLGRSECIGLSEEGRISVQWLAAELADKQITRIQTSPRLRCRQTAELLASYWHVSVEVVPELDEIDYGAWSGSHFADLENDPLWQAWNAQRDLARPPGGESMAELQQRVMGHMQALASSDPDGRIALVTHAEVIRAILLEQYRVPMCEFWRVGVEPASVVPMTWTGKLEAA